MARNQSRARRLLRNSLSASLGVLLAVLLIAGGATVASAAVDFTATSVVAMPDTLLQTDLITIDAVITNTGTTSSGLFKVKAWLNDGTDCDGNAYSVGVQAHSLAGGAFSNFQVSRIIDNVPSLGPYYVCIQLDTDDDVVESDETNNMVGGTSVPVSVVSCFDDLECDDGNACTDDTCDLLLGCLNAPNTVSCDDGLFCTVNDVCQGGACQKGTPRVCVEVDLCDGTMYCDELAGACVNGQAPMSCDDGDACNGVETCNPVDGLCVSGTPISCDVLINNGLGPPTAVNFIDHTTYDEASDQLVYVRSQSCPPSGPPDAACPSPGVPTTVEITTLGEVGDVEIFDTSLVEVTGGTVLSLTSNAGTWVDLTGGVVRSADISGTALIGGGDHGHLKLLAQATISGGTIENLELDSDSVSPGGTVRGGKITTLFSGTASAVRGGRISILCATGGDPGVIYGSDFTINGGLYGPFPGTSSGFVSGTLENGDPLNATFFQTGSTCYHPVDGTISANGTFTLLPPEATFVDNGLSPPDPQNVFDASVTAALFHDVFIRSPGCPDLWPSTYPNAPCAFPDATTSVDVKLGAVIPGVFSVLDNSRAIIRGGQLTELRMSAGAEIEVWGENFTIAGLPVAYGEVSNLVGTLVGTLASGDALSVAFNREDGTAPGTYGKLILKPATDLAAGNNVVGSLLGGVGVIGGIDFNVDVETGGTLTGVYQLVAVEDLSQVIPDSSGLVVAAGTGQDQYAIWSLDFTGTLLGAGSSTVTFAYDPSIVAQGQNLGIFAWNGVEWVAVTEGVLIFTFDHRIEVQIDSFTFFAMVTYPYVVPALSVLGMLTLVGGLVVSGIVARRRPQTGTGA